MFWRMEGPHGPGFVLSDCHSNSSSVPHLVIPPLKRRHNAHLNFAGSSLYPIYHFTINNWKLPWEFNTRHCTSGWTREKCEAGVGWNQAWPIQGHLESGALSPHRSPESRKICLVESVSRACFQKVQLHHAAECFRRKSGVRLLFL